MTLGSPPGCPWEEFKLEYGLDTWPTPERFAPGGATLAPLRAEVERLARGRPRKQPPVPVGADERYCWGCNTALPLASFSIDRQRADGLKMDCKCCDSAASARRRRDRRRAATARALQRG